MEIPPIDQVKLQKLLFYAHGWYLAQTSNPLFGEDFEAWSWGPVVRDVYNQTRQYGRSPVSKRIKRLSGNGGKGFLDFIFVDPSVIDPAIKAYVKAVWDTQKQFTGDQLSNATHLLGEPWTIVKDKYNGNLEYGSNISNDLIGAVFRQKMRNVTPSAATTAE